MTTATLYRDFDYGALAVVHEGRHIRLIDHGFADIDPVVSLFCENAEEVDKPVQDETVWLPRARPEILLANLQMMLREGGYSDDALGERAIFTVTVDEARAPDLPASGRCYVSEAVERAVAAHLDRAFGALGLDPALVHAQVMEAFPRPNAHKGRTLPFIRAQARVSVPENADDGWAGTMTGRFREGLAPLRGNLLRATGSIHDGVLYLEAGIAPTAKLVEEVEAGTLPVFEQSPIRGYRDAWLRPSSVDTAAIDRVRERASACSAAHSVLEEEGYVRVQVPAFYEDSHTGDPVFSERINWLARELNAELADVGEFTEGTPTYMAPEQIAEDATRGFRPEIRHQGRVYYLTYKFGRHIRTGEDMAEYDDLDGRVIWANRAGDLREANYSDAAKETIGKKMKAMKGEDKPQKQKVAIALATARRKGQKVPPNPNK